MRSSTVLAGVCAVLAGCAAYQAPPVEHPSSPTAYRNVRMPDPPPPARLPPRQAVELFVLLPGPDGKVGAIFIEKSGQRVAVDQAFGGAQISGAGAPQSVKLSEEEVNRQFGEALKAVPVRPVSFLLYFVSGRDELTEESQLTLRQMLAEVRSRPVPDVVVIGHTDTTGTLEANDTLSRQRAERMKAVLVGAGIAGERIQAAGRGEREPLVPTADNVAEPRNRRVEVNVR